MPSVAIARPHPDIGAELVRDWTPEGDSKATVVLVHGMADHSGRYERIGSLFAEAGYRVRSFDLIGAGGSGGARWDIDDWSRYHDQIQSHLEWARSLESPVVLMGHSVGGNLSLGYGIDSQRPQPDVIVASSPALSGGQRWQRALAAIALRVIPKVAFPNALDGEQLSRDPDVAEAYFADPLVRNSSTTRFGAQLFAAMDHVSRSAGSIAQPVLVLHGGSDTIVVPHSTAHLGDLPNFTRKLYPALRHELLNEPEGPEIVAEIIEWIESAL